MSGFAQLQDNVVLYVLFYDSFFEPKQKATH